MLMYLDLIIDYGCIGQCPSYQEIYAEVFVSEAGFLSAFNKVIGVCVSPDREKEKMLHLEEQNRDVCCMILFNFLLV